MEKPLKIILALIGVGVIALGSFAGGFVTGHSSSLAGYIPPVQQPPPVVVQAPTSSPEQQAVTPPEYQALFAPFWEAWNLVHENYVDQPVDDVALMRGAITGMMDALGDQHSSYMDPDTFQQANESLSGEYEGIGAYVDTTTEYLTITAPMPGSPAERAGLKPGDQVIGIDGEDMTGIDGELVRRKVIGPAGTTVHLTVRREGVDEPLEFDIVRENIVLKSASGRMLDNNIAYIQVTTFGDKTTSELLATLDELMAQDPEGIILDLRNNGGGYLHTSVEVTSQFVSEGVVLYEQYGDGNRTVYDIIPGGMATDENIPMVVLINEGSASASEIVAGALQDHGRAVLVGTQSYGKGSVQNWIPLSNEEGAVRVTIAKWLTPNEKTIHEIGLAPDVYVTCENCVIGGDDQDDQQLLAAVDSLMAMMAGEPIPTSMPTVTSNAISTPSASPVTPATTPSPTSESVLPTPTVTEADAVECPLAMTAHLEAGQTIVVTQNLNLRSSPGISSNLLQVIPANSQLEVIGNPTCVLLADGAYLWWQVKLPDGTVGWLAEGSLTGKFYFVEPVK